MPKTPVRACLSPRLLAAGCAAVLALGGAALPATASAATASSAAAAPVPRTARAAPHALTEVASLAADRLALADKVAAAKYGTPAPIDDPARERQVLDDVARRAVALGLDPAWAQAVFRDQMEANKQVQRGLYARWDAHPEERPAERPDLAKEVRPALDRITVALLDALRATAPARTSPACTPLLASAALRAAHTHGFDALHAGALARALPSVCG
ncbi:chorismate mutase [Streptomyces xanthii]|uniref:chorismate mutase n=1 Tax=Streptomyces xanthii TaxID=2768069 RepID=UPI001CB78BC2|nr:chorismate mutase [Streptomyces xanthii]